MYKKYDIKCDDLCPGRIFSSNRAIDPDVHFMEHNTLYYVEEGQGVPTHPLCDLFFCTKRGELVLIDVTGGSYHLVKQKVSKLAGWIEDNNPSTSTPQHHSIFSLPDVCSPCSEHDIFSRKIYVRPHLVTIHVETTAGIRCLQ